MRKKRKAAYCGLFISLFLFSAFTQDAKAQDEWTPERSLDVKRLSDLAFAPNGVELIYGINSVDLENNRYLTEYVITSADGRQTRTLLPPSSYISNAQWSPDGATVAYLSSESGQSNIWLVDAKGGVGRQLTRIDEDISSFQWAPDSKSIAFVMVDPDFDTPIVHDSAIFNKNHLWLVDASGVGSGDEIINLTSDENFSVSDWAGNWAYDWSPDSKSIVFAYQERPGLDSWTKAQLAIADIDTKQVTRIRTGNENWKYFPKYSPDGRWLTFINAPGDFKWSFLWNIMLLSVDDGEVVELAETKNQLSFPWKWASDSTGLYYIENDRATYSFYRMPIDGNAPEKIFGSPGDLNVPGLNTYLTSSFVDTNNDDRLIAFIGQTYNDPPEIYVGDTRDFKLRKITSVNDEFDDTPIGKTELVRWRSLDNTEVEGILTYPQNYDATKVYPLAVQIHGGPNGVDFNEYLPLMRFIATAAYSSKNYFILRVNYRGSLGYGREFREALIGKFGVLDYQDIMSGVNHVIDLGLVDADQMFLVGQSNGGTLTSWIITQSDRFRAACPIAGETDYISLEGTNGYFQTSWYLGGSFIDNLQMFLERSPIFHVRNVKTPTLIQGGLLDDNVPYTQLEEFHRALARVGVEVRLMGYPESTHDYYPPKLYLRLLQSCLDWTETHRSDVPTRQ